MTPLEKALALVGLGCLVFPVNVDKTPRTPHGFHDATDDVAQIQTWWTHWPDALVGVHAGPSELLVLDIDIDDDKNGWHSLDAAGLLPLPDTYNYKTRRGGSHFVYRAPEGSELDGRAALDGMVGVDRRAGASYFIWWDDEVPAKRAEFADAPEWLNAPAPARSTTAARGGDLKTWRERQVPGKPTAAVRAARDAITIDTTHDELIKGKLLSNLVKLGSKSERGAGEAFDHARAIYTPGGERRPYEWDKAAEGSIRTHGVPPLTLPLSKAERRAIADRAKPRESTGTSVEPRVVVLAPIVKGDDAGLAPNLAARLSHGLVWSAGGWYAWDGRRWAGTSHEHARERVRETLDGLAIEAFREREYDTAKWLRTATTIRNAESLLRGQLERDPAEFDAYPDELNVANGILDLRTLELRPHDPARLHTKVAPFPWRPGATHADVDAIVRAMPRTVRDWMQRRLGQAITGHVPDDDIVCIFRGDGNNAKSTLINSIMTTLGDYAALMPEQLLLAQQGDHPAALMELFGVRFAVSEELQEGHQLNVKRLKDLSGTGRMKARRLYQGFVEWSPTHSLFVSSNYRPRVAETDHGTWRRLALVVFPYRYVADPDPTDKSQRLADRRLRPRLEAGRGGRAEAMLAWLVDGARQWYEAGMVLPEAPSRVVADTTAWRETSDAVLAFINERLEFDPSVHVLSVELLNAFNAGLTANGQPSWGSPTFTERFEAHELFRRHSVAKARFLVAGSQPRGYRGVALRPDPAAAYLNLNRNVKD